jgi:hypothetical protein
MVRASRFGLPAAAIVAAALGFAGAPGHGGATARVKLDTARVGPGARRVVGPNVRRFQPSLLSGVPARARSWTLAHPVVFAERAATESFFELQQSVTALAGGGFGVVWIQGAYPSFTSRMQWLDASGNALLPAGGLLLGGSNQPEVVMAAHPTAGAYVAFRQGDTIRAQSYDGAGSARWPAGGVPVVDLNPGASESIDEPHLIANPGGGVFVCFGYSAVGPVIDIRCQLLDDSGARQWGAAGVSVGSGGDADLRVLPRGVSDGAGGILVFWRNMRQSYAHPDDAPMLMEGQHFDARGARLWGARPEVVRTTGLASTNGYTYGYFQVAADGSGGAVLAFDDWAGGDLAMDVMAQRVSFEGDLLWKDGAIVTAAVGHQQHEQTIGAGDGGAFVAVWDATGPNSNRLRIFRLGPDGSPAWARDGLLLSDPAATALDYGVYGSFDGGFLRLAWTHQTAPGTLEMDVRYVLYDLQGRRSGGPAGVPLTTAPDAQFLRGLAFSPARHGVLAVWDDRRKHSWDNLDVTGATLIDRFLSRAGTLFPRSAGAQPGSPEPPRD